MNSEFYSGIVLLFSLRHMISRPLEAKREFLLAGFGVPNRANDVF